MGTSVKPNGMSSAAAALRYWERRQEVSANNLANVSTEGFKGQRVFARLLDGAHPTADVATDARQGSIQQTGNPFDVAIDGNAYMVVNTASGERLSRGGTLHVDEQGVLADANGNAILGERGVLHIAQRGNEALGPLQISSTGMVTVGTTELGRLRLESTPPNTELAREGNGLYVPSNTRTPLSPDSTVVRQGALEESNVSSVSEMVDMIAIQRAYTAVQKAMSALDSARGIATTELGKPAN